MYNTKESLLIKCVSINISTKQQHKIYLNKNTFRKFNKNNHWTGTNAYLCIDKEMHI